MPRTATLDMTRERAWGELRLLASWDGEGTPGHEEGRRIVSAARRHVTRIPSHSRFFDDAMDVVDPTGNSFPVALAAAWDARKANA